MIFEEFNPNIHNSRQVAELVFDVDMRVFRRIFRSKEDAINAIEKKLLAKYEYDLQNPDYDSKFNFYVIYHKDIPSKLLGIVLVSKGENFNFLDDALFYFKKLKLMQAFGLTLVKFVDKRTLSHINEDDYYLAEIATKTSERCQGIGKSIMQHIIEEAKEQGFKRVVLDVDLKNNKAFKLYESMGFKIFDKKSFKLGRVEKDTYSMEYVFPSNNV